MKGCPVSSDKLKSSGLHQPGKLRCYKGPFIAYRLYAIFVTYRGISDLLLHKMNKEDLAHHLYYGDH